MIQGANTVGKRRQFLMWSSIVSSLYASAMQWWVTTSVNRNGLSEEVCSIYDLLCVFVLVKISESLFSYVPPLSKFRDFNSAII